MKIADRLALEIAVPTGGLPNLIRNPSGEMLAAGWSTASSVGILFVHPNGGLFFGTSGTAAYNTLYSDAYPMSAGQYAGGRVDALSVTGAFTVRIEFLDAAGTVLLLSPSSGYKEVPGVHYSTSPQAPAGTVKARLRLDLFSTATGAGPVDGSFVRFQRAMLTHAPTVAGLTVTRTNLIRNPSAEVDVAGWTASGGPAPVRSTAGGSVVGTAAFQVGASTSDVKGIALPSGGRAPVTAGAAYTAAASFKTGGARLVYVYLEFWTAAAGGRLIVGHAGSARGSTVGTWMPEPVTVTAIAPVGATHVSVYPLIWNPDGATSGVDYIDAVSLEQTGAYQGYLDGDNGGAWSSTPHLSPSSMTTGLFPYSEPHDWLDILGSTHSIEIDTDTLNLGTLAAEILDAALDPATSSTVRPGKQLRLRALVDGVWEHVWEGETSEGTTAYALAKDDPDKVRVTVTASNAIKRLANQGEPRGVGAVDDLATVLEGKGVPWILNGVSYQAAGDAAINAQNATASALDQVALTRDAYGGFAWVDRRNRLNVVDVDRAETVPWCALTDDTTTGLEAVQVPYVDTDIGWSTTSCINQVTVRYLSYAAATDATEELVFGPFVDQASVDTYGPFSREFTVQGTLGAFGAEWHAAELAARVLAANATPQVLPRSVTINAGLDEASFKAATLVDLYTPVRVRYSDDVDDVIRVTAIKHKIEATARGGTWLTEYGFEPIGAVASPTSTPGPAIPLASSGGGGGGSAPTAWVPLTLASGITSNASYGTPSARTEGPIGRLSGVISIPASSTAFRTLFTCPAGTFRTDRPVMLPLGTSGGTVLAFIDPTGTCFTFQASPAVAVNVPLESITYPLT